MQRAIDNKIYLVNAGPGLPQTLHVINNPNLVGTAMGFILNGQSVAPKQTSQCLPSDEGWLALIIFSLVNSQYRLPKPCPIAIVHHIVQLHQSLTIYNFSL